MTETIEEKTGYALTGDAQDNMRFYRGTPPVLPQEPIEIPKPDCPLDHAILKLLVGGRKSLFGIERHLKHCGRDTDSWEVRHKLGQLQSCGRVLLFTLPHETHDGIEVFGISQAGFEALVAYLRASSRTEVNPYGNR